MRYNGRGASRLLAAGRLFLLSAAFLLVIGSQAWAQEGGAAPKSGYQVGENTKPTLSDVPTTAGKSRQTDKSLRMARFDYLSGKVTWRSDDGAAWGAAKVNLPLHEGAQVWADEGGRAEMRFDDGSLLRLGAGAVVTFKTLYSDALGEFTQIKMISGVATLRLLHEHSIYQIDTPTISVKANGPARVRVGVADNTEVAVRLGSAAIEGAQGKITLHSGDYLSLSDADAPYMLQGLPQEDRWERWNDERDRLLDAAEHPVHAHPHTIYAPPPSVWFSLDFPIGHAYRSYGGGSRAARRHRR